MKGSPPAGSAMANSRQVGSLACASQEGWGFGWSSAGDATLAPHWFARSAADTPFGAAMHLKLDLDTGFGKFVVGQQLTPTDPVVSITRAGSRGAVRLRRGRGRWAAARCEPP